MTDEEALALLHEAAFRMSRGFCRRGVTAFVVIQNHDGTITTIGPNIPADCVDDLFGKAAEAHLRDENQHPLKN